MKTLTPNLKKKYIEQARPALKRELGLKNDNQVPRLEKLTLNMGLSAADKDAVKGLAEELGMIAGQKPVLAKSRKSISNFKLREGMVVGIKVTLRGARMYEFLDRLISAALPRIRDFRGLPGNSFDGRGNYTFGLTEQTVFPEIDANKVTHVQGMDVTIVTTTEKDVEAKALLKSLGFPFAA